MKDLGLCPICGKPIRQYQRRTCSKTCGLEWRRRIAHGPDNPDWKGGRYVEPQKGYVLVRQQDHPRARHNGYVLEHILVMEATLDRSLLPGERVHHRNHDPADNRSENLTLYQSNGQHLAQEGHHPQKGTPCPCGLPSVARGLCSRHYAQYRRTGRTWGFD